MTPIRDEDALMDERMRDVEGDIGLLKEWRKATVDPWIREDVATHKTIQTYMDQELAKDKVKSELDTTRHQLNVEKANQSLVLLTIGLFVGTLILIFLAYLTIHPQKGFLQFHATNSDKVLAEESILPHMR